ncbi:MAG: response regulator [Myxococcota bacterium]
MAWRDQGYLTVLVIDDDPELRELVQTVVIHEGHQAISVGSAEAGLELLPLNTFDVAFLDHRLPGMEGLVLGEYLHKNNPEMEVALVTGDASERLVRMAEARGLTVIAKPFEIEELVKVLETAVKRQKAAQRAAEALTKAPGSDGPIDLAPAFPHLAELFDLPGVPQRLTDLLGRRVRESLEVLQLHDPHDEKARTVAYSGIVAAQVLGLKLPHTKHGVSYADWYDQLMAESGRPSAFGGPGVT